MSEDRSITQYIAGLIDGDSIAANRIWDHYYSRLLALAEKKLQNCPRRVLDGDDVVQVAFENFFRQVKEHRFSELNDRNDLWQVLAMLVDRRAKDQFRKLTTEKNGYNIVRGDSVNQNSDQARVIDAVRSVEPTGEQAVEFAEEVEALLNRLSDPEYRKVALLKMSRKTNKEIADEIGAGLRTVERILENIRREWGDKV